MPINCTNIGVGLFPFYPQYKVVLLHSSLLILNSEAKNENIAHRAQALAGWFMQKNEIRRAL